MKRHVLATLGLSLIGSVQLIGCAEEDGEDCLPGDIECSSSSGSGKADGYEGDDDPRYFASNLEYKLDNLPKKGKLETPVWKDRFPEAVGKAAVAWADTYWPTSAGSHNARWQGASTKSPMEKYDAAFNNAPGCATQPPMSGRDVKAQWDTYNQCAGPATKWQANMFQGGGKMHDGIDNDGDGKTDEYGDDGVDGIAGWWGTCHAWAPAALHSPEPQHSVTINGVTFDIADIKALTQNIYDRTSAVMLGGRCNNKEINHTVEGSANDDCADVNPGAFHVILTNFLGLRQAALVEDRTANYEVWNQPILGYEITKQDTVTASVANTCVGATGSSWKYNTSAKSLVEVRATLTYLSESGAENRVLGWQNNTSTDDYHYILELNSSRKVIGGRYCTDSSNSHVDFLWAPTGTFSPSNPSVDKSKVLQIIKASVSPQTPGGGGTTRDFPVSPASNIPDATPAGVSIDISVTGVTGPKGLTVDVDITHSYRGDLVLKLAKNGAAVKTLLQNVGGSQDDVKESFSLTAAEIGTDVNTRWTLQVIDTEAQDVGTVNQVTLKFAL